MCRFLLAKSKQPIQPQDMLFSFSSMVKKSRAFDGDWQGDGWGIAWLDDANVWQLQKSLHPLWEDEHIFATFPKTRLFLIHARSASFPQHKNNIVYNQPYIAQPYAFVFNGLLKGVRLSSSISGTIGAQKIWSLLQNIIKNNTPQAALTKVKTALMKNSKEIQALNIGLADKKNIYALCFYSNHPTYYQLHYTREDNLSLICSEHIGNLTPHTLHTNQVLML